MNDSNLFFNIEIDSEFLMLLSKLNPSWQKEKRVLKTIFSTVVGWYKAQLLVKLTIRNNKTDIMSQKKYKLSFRNNKKSAMASETLVQVDCAEACNWTASLDSETIYQFYYF